MAHQDPTQTEVAALRTTQLRTVSLTAHSGAFDAGDSLLLSPGGVDFLLLSPLTTDKLLMSPQP